MEYRYFCLVLCLYCKKYAMKDVKFNYNPHISVDCVVFGFDGEKLKILLIERNIDEGKEFYSDKKLPGSIIYEEEGLDTAASRILTELTGLKNVFLTQFHSFGDPKRSSNPRDVNWLEMTTQTKIGRIVTVAYIALIKIDRKIVFDSESTTAKWYDLDDLANMKLAFDHNEIALKALSFMRRFISLVPNALFELLPKKFTMTELRSLHDIVVGVTSDVRNFQKKVLQTPGLIPLDEVKKNVPHRAPKLYSFDKRKGSKIFF